jgi:ATP-dependent protease ClpP protease subunit
MRHLKEFIAAMTAHWRNHANGHGNLSHICFYYPMLAISPLVVFIAISFASDTHDLPFVQSVQGRALTVTAFLSLAGAAWWCWGVYRAAMHRLETGFLFVPLVLFTTAATSGWHLIVTVLPASAGLLEYDRGNGGIAHVARESSGAQKPAVWSVLPLPELKRIVATGPIEFGSAQKLQSVILANPNLRLLELDSKGGNVSEMEKLVAVVRHHQLDTVVLNKCYSACTDVFLAGERRYTTPYARFAFHQSGYVGMQKPLEWSVHENMTSIFYRERDIEKSFFAKALNTPYEAAWRPTALEVKRSGFANTWWFDRTAEYR